jgi:hypothetical protein
MVMDTSGRGYRKAAWQCLVIREANYRRLRVMAKEKSWTKSKGATSS